MKTNFLTHVISATLKNLKALPSATGIYATAKSANTPAKAVSDDPNVPITANSETKEITRTSAHYVLPNYYLTGAKKTLHKRVKRTFATYLKQDLEYFDITPSDPRYKKFAKELSELYALRFANELSTEKQALVNALNYHYRKFCGLGLKHGLKSQLLFAANSKNGLLPVLLRQHDFSKRPEVRRRTLYIARSYLVQQDVVQAMITVFADEIDKRFTKEQRRHLKPKNAQ